MKKNSHEMKFFFIIENVLKVRFIPNFCFFVHSKSSLTQLFKKCAVRNVEKKVLSIFTRIEVFIIDEIAFWLYVDFHVKRSSTKSSSESRILVGWSGGVVINFAFTVVVVASWTHKVTTIHQGIALKLKRN